MGKKISIALEELAIPCALHVIDRGKLEQKQPSVLKFSPNARIPAIIDRDLDDFAIFESGAILIQLAVDRYHGEVRRLFRLSTTDLETQ